MFENFQSAKFFNTIRKEMIYNFLTKDINVNMSKPLL